MIASLKGTLERVDSQTALLDVGGVGYLVCLPTPALHRLPPQGSEVTLYIYTHVKEDAIQLFGFETWEERNLFQLFLSVSGIGPKGALQILSKLAPHDSVQAIQEGKVNTFTSIPGIGQKTAERILIELRDKIKGLLLPLPTSAALVSSEDSQDVFHALIALGYRERDIRSAIQQLQETKKETNGSVEDMIRNALQILS